MIKLFDFMRDVFKPLPDMRKHTDMLTNVKTTICGKKDWRKCEFGYPDCHVYCRKVNGGK